MRGGRDRGPSRVSRRTAGFPRQTAEGDACIIVAPNATKLDRVKAGNEPEGGRQKRAWSRCGSGFRRRPQRGDD